MKEYKENYTLQAAPLLAHLIIEGVGAFDGAERTFTLQEGIDPKGAAKEFFEVLQPYFREMLDSEVEAYKKELLKKLGKMKMKYSKDESWKTYELGNNNCIDEIKKLITNN